MANQPVINSPNRVREHRLRLRLTLDGLAAKTGLSKQFLSRLERGERELNGRVLATLSEALGVHKTLIVGESLSNGVQPLQGDKALDEMELIIIRFWRSLPREGKHAAFVMMSEWANGVVGGAVAHK